MATNTMRIRVRRDTAANLAGVVPDDGEPTYEKDTKLQRIGDGVTSNAQLDASAWVDGVTHQFGPEVRAAIAPASAYSAATMTKWFAALARVRTGSCVATSARSSLSMRSGRGLRT